MHHKDASETEESSSNIKKKTRNFICNDCGKQYKTKNELTLHINSKCGIIKQFTCMICGKGLMSSGSLYNHMLRHKGTRSYMCRFCAKLFFTAGQLKVHERIHTKDKAYVCEVCNKGFCHRQSLITHSTIHTGIKPFQCENCGNSFSCIGNLIKHRKTHADTCGQIPLTTHRVQNPATRMKVKINTPASTRLKMRQKDEAIQNEPSILKNDNIDGNDTEENKIKCEGEERQDFKEDTTQNHSDTSNGTCDGEVKCNKTKHPKKDVDYENLISKFVVETDRQGYSKCKFCGKKYRNVGWLYKHIKAHRDNNLESDEELEVPSHKCSCCKMSFFSKEENLKHQQSQHVDVLTCHDCEKIFSNRDSLRSHQNIFHKGIPKKIYYFVCDKCGERFKQKSFLQLHVDRNCSMEPFYECSVCKKRFSNRYTRNNHMRVHDPEKKLLCKFCAKSFHWKGQLKIHERSHTGEKPFACLYCPKAFAYRESLITHSSVHTGIKPHVCESCGSRFSCVGNLIKHKTVHADECGPWDYKTHRYSESAIEGLKVK